MIHILLFSVLTIQALYIAIVNATPNLHYKLLIPLAVNILAFFCSPIQGGLSDKHCRKKSLIFALVINLFASFFFVFWLKSNFILFLILYITVLGIAGNAYPIAISTYKDISKKFINFRFFLSLSLFYYYSGDFLPVLSNYFINSNMILELTFVLLFLSILITFKLEDKKDTRKKESISILSEIKYIYQNFLKHKVFLLCFIGYLFFEISVYEFTFRTEIFKGLLAKIIPIELILGTFLGTLFFKYIKWSDDKIFVLGIFSQFFNVGFIYISLFLHFYNTILLSSIIVFLGFSYCLVYSSTFCLLSRKRHHHDHGKIFGMLESIDNGCNIAAIIIVSNFLKISNESIFLISLLLYIVAAIFLLLFLHNERKIPQLTQ